MRLFLGQAKGNCGKHNVGGYILDIKRLRLGLQNCNLKESTNYVLPYSQFQEMIHVSLYFSF